ncbi:MAG: putative glyoxalase family protein [Candidatus Eremiobacteraeota bacterium]|jgi:PhnB protein|nr:putative glyoxalase family protein [Candidatus Eremiobacteraeota bacterium]
MESIQIPAEARVMQGVVPFVVVSDAAAAAELYKDAFGADVLQRVPADDGKRLLHCHLRINGGSLVINDAFPEHGYALEAPQSFTLHLQVDDVDRWWGRAIDAGFEIVMPLELQFWGDRYGIVKDRFGVSWSIATAVR